MSRRLHVGVVGAGRIGGFHARTLRMLPRVERLTIADLDAELAARVAADVGAEAAAGAEELLERGADALVIATPTRGHAPLLRLAASARLPAFCEKPVALELTELDALVAEVERAGTLVQVGFQRRFDAGYRAAREAVASGAVGTLLVVRAATHDPAPPAESYVAGSGGIFRDLHVHDLDAIRWVTGEEIVEVYADGAVRATGWFSRHGDVDAAVAALRLSGGALGIVSGTRHDPLGYDVRLELFGTGDSITVGSGDRAPLHSVEPGTTVARGPGWTSFLDRFEPAYRAELAAFVDAACDGGPSPCTLADARAALAVAVAADRSRAEHRPVRIGETTGFARAGA